MNQKKYSVVVFVMFSVLGFLLYYPILHNDFLSDDYDSLYRICIEKTIIIKQFLRPLIDISFKFNYLLGGLNATGYYIFNIIVHIINTYLIYTIATLFKLPNDKPQRVFAWVSALLFMLYPFHNEAIVWLTGRLSSIACLFALSAIRISLSSIHKTLKAACVCLLYYIGLLAYESVLLLPFIIWLFAWNRTRPTRKHFLLLWGCMVALISYLLIRYWASDVVYGDYGSRITDNGGINIITKAAKTWGRILLPPCENSAVLTVSFLILMSLAVFLCIRLYKIHGLTNLLIYTKLFIALVLAMIIPMLFGISTKTSEGDRLLYFPSVFLCMILAYLIVVLVEKQSWRLVLFSASIGYFLSFLIMNNQRWITASRLSATLIEEVQEAAHNKYVIIANLPDEVEGAFVFRNGFYKAMILHNVDTGKIWVNNYLTRSEYLKLPPKIMVFSKRDGLFLPPASKVTILTNDSVSMENISTKQSVVFNKNNTVIFYWNKTEIIQLF
jgi:hypothetical protein